MVDMTTINTTDLEGEYKEKLDGHLHSDDFFGTATHKTASLEITSVKASGKNAYDATANLTIKNITKEVVTIMYDSERRENLRSRLLKVRKSLGDPGVLDRVAESMIDFIRERRKGEKISI